MIAPQATDTQGLFPYPHDLWISLCTVFDPRRENRSKHGPERGWSNFSQTTNLQRYQWLGRETRVSVGAMGP
jgi:hypothetical protein